MSNLTYIRESGETSGQQRRGRRQRVFRLSVPFSLMRYLPNTWREFPQIWHEHSLGLRDEVIPFWCAKVKGRGHCDLVNAAFQEHLEGILSDVAQTFTHIYLLIEYYEVK